MKIEIRRKVANGLVIGLQLGAAAHAGVPVSGLEAFVAHAPAAVSAPLDPGNNATGSADPQGEQNKALGWVPTGCDPSGGGVGPGSVAFQPSGSDPSGLPFIRSPDITLPNEERCASRETLKEPFDDG